MIYRIGPAGLEAKMLETLGVKKASGAASFGEIFQKAVADQLSATNELIRGADQKGIDFALGKTDDIAEVMAAQEIASASLQFTVQLRNSFLEAYNEIMRLQV
ncbi:flagellar hook-basal body complex protein FliE [Lachnospiraceae bacterium oral taxon 500]|nr:flagellar hook-basal body complex protein FliE [Lachnospiraceae bacterium oral taxon 500]